MNKFLVFFWLAAGCTALWAQTGLDGLLPERIVSGSAQPNAPATPAPVGKRTAEFDTLQLPFFQNFTTSRPDTFFWELIRDPHINQTGAYLPPDKGTLLFDGTQRSGAVHSLDGTAMRTDSAICSCIDLSGYSPADAVYLTFWYQASGRNDSPEFNDSLVVEFRVAPDSNELVAKYQKVWYATGELPDSAGFWAEIQLDNTVFFHNCFQVKWVSFGNSNGFFDVWHVDYIYLNARRREQDIYFQDAAVVGITGSPFDSLSFVPHAVYTTVQPDSIRNMVAYVQNLDQDPQTRTLHFRMLDAEGNFLAGKTLVVELDGVSATAVALPSLAAPQLPEGSSIRLQVYLEAQAGDTLLANDTLSRTYFIDSYSRAGDGEPEAGYGVFASRGFAQFHSIPIPDTLVAIWCNWVASGNPRAFRLAVWENQDSPDDVLFAQFVSTRFDGQQVPWIRYALDTAQVVDGRFAVGAIQLNDTPLGMGLDQTDPVFGKIYYDFLGDWRLASVPGSLCMILEFASGKQLSLNRNQTRPTHITQPENLTLYPNPATDHLRLRLAGVQPTSVRKAGIMDASGRTVWAGNLQLSNGEALFTLPAEWSAGRYYFWLEGQNANQPYLHGSSFLLTR